jgi:hypothetical protein
MQTLYDWSLLSVCAGQHICVADRDGRHHNDESNNQDNWYTADAACISNVPPWTFAALVAPKDAISVHFSQHLVLVVGQHTRRRYVHGISASHEQYFLFIAEQYLVVAITLFHARDQRMYNSVNVVGVFIFCNGHRKRPMQPSTWHGCGSIEKFHFWIQINKSYIRLDDMHQSMHLALASPGCRLQNAKEECWLPLLECPCAIYLYESHLYGYLPTRTSGPHSYESGLYISVPATCNSTCTKHKSDICRLIRVRHTRTGLLFCAFAVPACNLQVQQLYQKTNLKFIYVCLFVISLSGARQSKKHERQTITAPIIYRTCDFGKTSSRCYCQKAGCCMCYCHDRWPGVIDDEIPTCFGNQLLTKYFFKLH